MGVELDVRHDLELEAKRLLAAAAHHQVTIRLIGGMAIRLLLGDRLHASFRRVIQDLDFVVSRSEGRRVGELFVSVGYEPDVEFNALHGARRMLFKDARYGRQIDVFVGAFEMCHRLPLADRLACLPETLPAADVLLTKLQIVELNAKDCGDICALLLGHELGNVDENAINVGHITALTSGDWGLHHTVALNLARVQDQLPSVELPPDARATIGSRIDALANALEEAPKSRAWKVRARIGERKQWYDQPEEVDRD
jgi:hypothetical protein